MGIIPGGTGNDYRRCLNIPKDPAKAAKTLLLENVRTVDCMQVDEFVGLNISTVGFDSEVVRNAERYARFGGLSYLLSVLYTVPRYSPPEIRVTIDGEPAFWARASSSPRATAPITAAACACCPIPTRRMACWTSASSIPSGSPGIISPFAENHPGNL